MDILSLGLNIASLSVLIYLSGRFSGSEIALTSLTKMDVAEMKIDEAENADLIEELKSDMDRTIITILIGNNLVNVTASALATRLSYVLLGDWGVSLAVGLLTFFLLVFGEISPKGFAIKNKKQFSQNNAKMIYYLSRGLDPVITGLEKISEAITDLLGGRTKEENIKITEEDIKDLASVLEEEGTIKGIEKDILNRVFWFGDKKVRSVKIPKERIVYLRPEATVKKARDIINKYKFTRTPVIRKNSGEVEGVLYSKDVLGCESGHVRDFMREPKFVKNDAEITDVFKWMKKNRIHMAIVEDNRGRFDGIITLEDIIEELVGEIYDEFDKKKFF